MLDLPYDEYVEKCVNTLPLLKEKAKNGTLELMDLLQDCYEPRCIGGDYDILQCSSQLPGWCWCSTSDGIRIDGTLKEGLKYRDCGKFITSGCQCFMTLRR